MLFRSLPQASANVSRPKYVEHRLGLARSRYSSDRKYEVFDLVIPVLVDFQAAVLSDGDETRTFYKRSCYSIIRHQRRRS